MKKYIVLILAFIVVKTSWSQNTHLDNKYAVKVYNLTSYEELIKIKTSKDNPSVSIQNASKEFQIFHPTIAFQWLNKRKNFHEIELTNIKFRKIESEIDEIDHTAGTNQAIFASDLSAVYISLRYEYIFNLNKKDNKPYMASLGVGLNPYYIQNNYSTSVTTAFPISENHIGLKKFITPRFTYFMTSKLFIDVNIPFCIFDSYYQAEKENNPNIPNKERSILRFELNSFPTMYSARIGIGIKL